MTSFFVVEDEDIIRKGICGFLTRIDNIGVVGSAPNGKVALEQIKRLNPDVVLTDIVMPHMDGLKMADELRRGDWQGELIFISAYQDAQYLQNAIRVSSADYLFKPIENMELKRTVLRVAQRVEDSRRKALPVSSNQLTACRDSALCQKIQSWVMDNLQTADTKSLSAALSMSKSNLYREFSRLFGSSVNAYITKMRMEQAYALLRDSGLMVYQVSGQVGYHDVNYFSRVFKATYGFYPGECRKKNMRVSGEET